jgi:hypothetical protein
VKAQCERCKEIVELRFALGSGGIDVECPECQARYFVPAPVVGQEAPPATGKPCPKCGHRQLGGEACKKCGLVFSRWTGSTTVLDDDAEGAALWARVVESWGDPARHDAVLAWVQRSTQFAWLAGKYRVAREERGAAAEPAVSTSLARIEKLALTTLVMSGSRKPGEAEGAGKTPYKKSMVVLMVLLVVLGVGLVAALMMRKPPSEDRFEPAGPAVPRMRPQ